MSTIICTPTEGTTHVATPIPARSTRYINLTLRKPDGTALDSAAQVTSIAFTLVEPLSGAVINGRNAIDVKDANGGELEDSGAFSLKLTPEDTREYGTRALQPRRVLLDVRFDAGANRENHIVLFDVEYLPGLS